MRIYAIDSDPEESWQSIMSRVPSNTDIILLHLFDNYVGLWVRSKYLDTQQLTKAKDDKRPAYKDWVWMPKAVGVLL